MERMEDIIEMLSSGKYRRIRSLGTGGMGTVELVEHSGLKKQYAMKLVTGAAGTAERRQLENEAARMRLLRDRRIPYLTDYLEAEEAAALIMEYIPGESLEEYIRAHAPLPEEEALAIFRQLCGIVAYLHAQRPRIVHCDLKPANFIRTPEGGLRLLDFGSGLSGYGRTAGAAAGTYGYCPPEQRRGEALSAAADVYALGAIYSYLLTGHDPAKPPYLIADAAQYGRGVSSDSVALLRRCIAEEPTERWADAGVLEQAAQRLLPGRYRSWEKIRESAYQLALWVTIALWGGVIYARETGCAEAYYERGALLLLLPIALWFTYRSYVDRTGHFVLENDIRLLYTEKQAPGL